MKRKWMLVTTMVLAIAMVVSLGLVGCKTTTTTTAAAGTVTITVTSWRTEDIKANEKINAIFMKKYPNINVKFSPIKNTEYYAQLGTALETGTNVADIMSLHGYGPGLKIYNGGYLMKLNNDNVPGISDVNAQGAWTSEDGTIYAVPWCAVSHGIYYNKAIFDKYGLTEPKTWAEFINICDTLLKNGETVIAQGSKDGWTLYETSYCNYGANFYGGETSRQKLIKGEMKVTDEPFVKAFKASASLVKYYPKGYQALDYVSSEQMFASGKAAIFIGGSWEVQPFRDIGLDFELGWFAPPVENEGDKIQYSWNNGGGYGVYINTPHPKEALTYASWLLTSEYTQALMDNLPGFFGYIPGDYKMDPIAQKMLDVVKNSDLTERLAYEKLSDQEPSGNILFTEALQKLANGEYTPEEAAKYVQDGLDNWYYKK